MAANLPWKFVVWERLNKTGKWCPYSAEVSQLIEQSYKKKLDSVSLGDADENLKIYSVNLKDMVQVSKVTGTKSTIRRRLCDNLNTLCNGVTWQWCDGQESWHSYDIDVNNFIESAFKQGVSGVALKKEFRGYKYEIDFKNMLQINKQSKRKRPIRRQQGISPYPASKCGNESSSTDDNVECATAPPLPPTMAPAYSDLMKDIPGTDSLVSQVNDYMRNVKRTFLLEDNNALAQDGNLDLSHSDNANLTGGGDEINSGVSQSESLPNSSPIAAIVNGRPWYDSRPPHTHHSKLKPVPGIEPLQNSSKKPKKKKKVKHGKIAPIETGGDITLEEYANTFEIAPDTTEVEDCIICCEPLSGGSSYDNDASLVQLKLCPHVFHKSCLLAMYNSGPKDKCLQCPICKKIYGVKCGIQPSGDMIYHVLPYSLPGYPECDTIRIIYDISSGTQGPEHPNPGKKYTTKGFPRHCYLPDNEMGRKVLRLLIKAWKRRLVFTIGRSSTTGEENTVTWNEIHHKTEFGCNRRGHGFPDPNYFTNVLAELEAHGVKEDEIFMWYPA